MAGEEARARLTELAYGNTRDIFDEVYSMGQARFEDTGAEGVNVTSAAAKANNERLRAAEEEKSAEAIRKLGGGSVDWS